MSADVIECASEIRNWNNVLKQLDQDLHTRPVSVNVINWLPNNGEPLERIFNVTKECSGVPGIKNISFKSLCDD